MRPWSSLLLALLLAGPLAGCESPTGGGAGRLDGVAPAPGASAGSVGPGEAIEALRERLPGLLEASGTTGISLAIANGEGVVTAVAGVRSLDTGAAVTAATLFEAASLSKPVFAFAVLRLAQRGIIDLDVPLAHLLANERLEHDPRYRTITARLVLSHQGGLPNWGGTPLEMIGEPGARFSYSGEGYVYLAKVVEKLTGLTLNELADQEVFTPLGMRESSFVWRVSFSEQVAAGHSSAGEVLSKTRLDGEDANAAASLLTTARDYAIFLSAVLTGDGLAGSMWKEMLRPQIQVAGRGSGDLVEGLHWGLGWGLQDGPAGTAFFHWGDNDGYKAYTLGYPGQGRALVYFTNSDEGLSLVNDIVSSFIDDEHLALAWLDYEQHDSPEMLARRALTGAFLQSIDAGRSRHAQLRSEQPGLEFERLMNRVGYRLLAEEDVEAAVAAFDLNVESYPESANVHDSLAEAHMTAGRLQEAVAGYERSLALDPENGNALTRLEWIREEMAARSDPPAVPAARLEQMVGSFGPVEVFLRDGEPFTVIDGFRRDYRLLPMSPDTFLLDGLGVYRLRFVTGESGDVHKVIGLQAGGPAREFSRDS